MKEYDVVYGYDLRSFVSVVDEYLSDGWNLAGGVSSMGEQYMQAVWREILEQKEVNG